MHRYKQSCRTSISTQPFTYPTFITIRTWIQKRLNIIKLCVAIRMKSLFSYASYHHINFNYTLFQNLQHWLQSLVIYLYAIFLKLSILGNELWMEHASWLEIWSCETKDGWVIVPVCHKSQVESVVKVTVAAKSHWIFWRAISTDNRIYVSNFYLHSIIYMIFLKSNLLRRFKLLVISINSTSTQGRLDFFHHVTQQLFELKVNWMACTFSSFCICLQLLSATWLIMWLT